LARLAALGGWKALLEVSYFQKATHPVRFGKALASSLLDKQMAVAMTKGEQLW